MSDALREGRMKEFLQRLTREIVSHTRWRHWDSGLYQFLVIGSAIAGFFSLWFGLLAANHNNSNYGLAAGVIGALTSVGTILSQQLHCVKAVTRYRSCQISSLPTASLSALKLSPNCSVILALKSLMTSRRASTSACDPIFDNSWSACNWATFSASSLSFVSERISLI